MRDELRRSLIKWTLLLFLGLTAYFSGWILGTRYRHHHERGSQSDVNPESSGR